MLYTENLEQFTNDEVNINNKFGNLSVRLSGAYITRLSLKKDGIERPILYCDDNKNMPKINASHPMCPVGKYSGLGGQHGFPRKVNYNILTHKDALIDLTADDIYDGIKFKQRFIINKNGFSLICHIANMTARSVYTSMGEHLYFCNYKDFSNIKLNNASLSNFLGMKAIENIRKGIAKHIFCPDKKQVIDIDGNKLILELDSNYSNLIGLSFWQRPATKSFCIEPTLGYVDDGNMIFSNSLIKLSPREIAKLKINISLI